MALAAAKVNPASSFGGTTSFRSNTSGLSPWVASYQRGQRGRGWSGLSASGPPDSESNRGLRGHGNRLDRSPLSVARIVVCLSGRSPALHGWVQPYQDLGYPAPLYEQPLQVIMMVSEVIMREPPYPRNAPGPFYVESQCCISCDAPYSEAPDLMDHDDGVGGYHCHFPQPMTREEPRATFRPRSDRSHPLWDRDMDG
jgi:hypothetical protein